MKRSEIRNTDKKTIASSSVQSITSATARIRMLIDGGKLAEAWQTAKGLQEKHENDPVVNYIAALVLFSANEKRAALRYAETAVKYAPDGPLYHLFLGKLYVDLQMLELVPAVLERAAILDKSMFQAPWIMADYYFGLGQDDKALQYYLRALEVVPPVGVGSLKLAYANCIAAMGRIDEAEAVYSELFQDKVLRIAALERSALLRKHDDGSKMAAQIRRELADSELDRNDRSLLLLCLGRLLENGRKYDEAYQSFHESRKLLDSTHDIDLFRASVDDAIRVMTPSVALEFKEFGDPSDRPIFVVGMPRSGTTMTEQIIASHSQAEGAGELKRISHLEMNIAGGRGMAVILSKMAEMGPSRWNDVSKQYLNLLDALAPNARHVVDKMPHNFQHIGFIHLCFPNAKIIHCKRNPLDNFVSAFQNKMNNPHGYAYNQTDYGEYYLEYKRLMDHWKSVFPDKIYESQYEVLTQNPEAEVRKILDFLGLPWEDACLNFNERQSTVKTLSKIEVRSPINMGSVGRWKNYQSHLSPIIEVFKRAGVQV